MAFRLQRAERMGDRMKLKEILFPFTSAIIREQLKKYRIILTCVFTITLVIDILLTPLTVIGLLIYEALK